MYSVSGKSNIRVALALLLMACGDTRPTAIKSGAPFTVGVITAVDAVHGYFVDASSGTGVPPKTFFHIEPQTTFERAGGRSGSANDLAIGVQVAVWATIVVPASEPPEVVATHVLIYLQP